MNKRLGIQMTRSNFSDFGKDQQDKYIESLESQKKEEKLSIDDSYVQYLKEKELNMTWIIREQWLVEFGEILQNIKT